jgi:REP element-mobilizing transposase RayT
MAGKHISLLVHFIWSTAGREPWIGEDWREPLHSYLGGIAKNKKARLLAAGGMHDHIHLYASLPSTITIADFVSAMKSNSSRWVHENFANRQAFAWQEGYGAFTVSKSEEQKVMRYITNQSERHRKHTFKEEFLIFLEKHAVEYNEQYLWD